jgi:Flp pilus assembly protein TadB
MLVLLVIGAFLPGVAFATAEKEALALEAEKFEIAHNRRLKELDLEAREAELGVERQMHELELEARRAEIERSQRGPYRHRKKHGGFACLIVLIMIIIRALTTIWVYGDLQRRKTGSGLWIPIVLLGGLLGLLVYAVIRLGDMRQTQDVSGVA